MTKETVTIPSDIRLHDTGQLGKLVGYLPSGTYGVRLEGHKEVLWYSEKCFDVLPVGTCKDCSGTGYMGHGKDNTATACPDCKGTGATIHRSSTTKPVKKQPATKGARK